MLMKNLLEMILSQNLMKNKTNYQKLKSVTKGDVDSVTILNGGSGYKVGDLTEFDDKEQMVLDLVHK